MVAGAAGGGVALGDRGGSPRGGGGGGACEKCILGWHQGQWARRHRTVVFAQELVARRHVV